MTAKKKRRADADHPAADHDDIGMRRQPSRMGNRCFHGNGERRHGPVLSNIDSGIGEIRALQSRIMGRTAIGGAAVIELHGDAGRAS